MDEKIAVVLARRREIEENMHREAQQRREIILIRQNTEWAAKDEEDAAQQHLVCYEYVLRMNVSVLVFVLDSRTFTHYSFESGQAGKMVEDAYHCYQNL